MKLLTVSLILLLLTLSGCSSNNAEDRLGRILNEIKLIHSRQEKITDEIIKTPSPISKASLNGFPDNRSQLELNAKEHLRLFNETIENMKREIELNKQIEQLPVSDNFRQFSKLNRETVEKFLEKRYLDIQQHELIFDKTIVDSEILEAKILAIEQQHKKIREEIDRIEQQKIEVKKTLGK